ncbi:hypothetical protein C8R46DRAFT_1228070 [Mycena filopes]|nr:hypothetical protein C8R46DRAFT_1228070 [Mycena filopes]
MADASSGSAVGPKSNSASHPTRTLGPDLSSPIYGDRKASGQYDSIAQQLLDMGPGALANLDYPGTITRSIEDWSKNHRYLNAQGEELQVAVVGEVLGPAQGTLVRASGNYFARDGDNFKPVDDKSKIKDVLAIGVPTASSRKLYNTFLNQVIVACQIAGENADEDARLGKTPIVKAWTKASKEGSNNHDIMIINTLPKYGVPSAAGAPRARRVAKRRLDEEDEDEPGPDTTKDSDEIQYPSDDDIQLGAHYEPTLLPDFGGSYFNLVKAKLVQHDIRDLDNALIPPWKMYDALKPGTLILALCSLHCFNMVDSGGKEVRERKIYQINAHSIRVLSESDEYVEVRTRPIAPNSSDRPNAVLPERAVAAAFSNFVVAAPAPPEENPDDMHVEDGGPTDQVGAFKCPLA